MPDSGRQDPGLPVKQWLDAFEAGLQADRSVADLFGQECFWRDVLAFTWRLDTFEGAEVIAEMLEQTVAATRASGFRLDESRTAPAHVTRAGDDCIEAFFLFETAVGTGEGIVRLKPDADRHLKCWTLLTALAGLKDHPERIGQARPTGQSNARDFRGPNWLDKRRIAQAYEDRDPAVVVVGGGQAGLATAARLTQLGVDTLIVDRHERIGDSWRKRYHALTLHNQVQVNHMPYMPFPPNWPTYIPKDKLANWFEAYVEAMELNYWTGTEFQGGSYDDAAGHWTVDLKRPEGTVRTMRPRHVVMATGVSGIANRPDIPTLENFRGPVLHSSQYSDGEDWSGKHAMVIGTGNSGHDISHDLASSGADVTLVQRSPTLIVNIEPSAQIPYALYDSGPSLEDCDLIVVSTPTTLSRRAHQMMTRQAKEMDRDLLDGLTAKGFRLDDGEDGTGWQFKYLTRGGGYYFNVGASDMIVNGEIGLAQFDDIEAFSKDGVRMKDGAEKPLDLVVLATGYKPQEYLVEHLFGPELADRVGPIWGFGAGQELRNMYCRTPQPGIWFIAGSLAQCRINSKYLALQIKAVEEGLIRA
ncbi:flavin-containing monooxygenase [Minwuia sp.]|uniref:flavin-containing monooxygenase n=1 Tax=Minwuia sp. TaxID=2493630 RepID=UPI003A90E1FA